MCKNNSFLALCVNEGLVSIVRLRAAGEKDALTPLIIRRLASPAPCVPSGECCSDRFLGGPAHLFALGTFLCCAACVHVYRFAKRFIRHCSHVPRAERRFGRPGARVRCFSVFSSCCRRHRELDLFGRDRGVVPRETRVCIPAGTFVTSLSPSSR